MWTNTTSLNWKPVYQRTEARKFISLDLIMIILLKLPVNVPVLFQSTLKK